MIKIYDFNVDEIITFYKNEVFLGKIDNLSQYVYYSENKKDSEKQYFVRLDNVVNEKIKECGIKNGLIVCNSKHTTSSVFVNHFEQGILFDVLDTLKTMYPPQKKYRHNIWDFEYKNADAHLKSISLGKGATVFVKDGEMILGDFENVIYAEFDHRPMKSFNLIIIGE